MKNYFLLSFLFLFIISSCTIPFSKTYMDVVQDEITGKHFEITEEDQGFSLFGVFEFSSPDKADILIQKAKVRYNCKKLKNIEVEYFQQNWIIIGFPILRINATCIQ